MMSARVMLRCAVVCGLLAAPAWAQTVTSPVKAGPRGDVTLDGTVSAADAQAILFSVVGLALPSGYAPLPWGDVNGDGKLGAVDAQIVLAYAAKLPTTGFAVGANLARVYTLGQPRVALLPGQTQQLAPQLKDSA